jgi:Kef-type K+ transport system membrane component KefB
LPAASLGNLLAVLAIAFGAPFLLGLAPRIRVPSSVIEIVVGIVVGPSVLGWVEVDEPLRVLSTIGLAFLLFLSGLQVDLSRARGKLGNVVLAAFGCSLLLAIGAAAILRAAGVVESAPFIAIVLASTAPGIVIPLVRDAGFAASTVGQVVVAGAGVSAAGTAVLLSAFYSRSGAGTGTRAVLLGAFGLLLAAIGFVIARAEGSSRVGDVLIRLQDTTAQIRVRAAVLLLVGIVVLAQKLGLEVVLSAFVAGAVLRLVDRDAEEVHPNFFVKMDAIGYGFVVPIFFVTSGLRFDGDALFGNASALLRVPALLAALLVVRVLPAVLYRSSVGMRRAIAAGLLQATSLTFVVAAARIGMDLGTVGSKTGAAMVAAGLLSAVIFPPVALGLLRAATTEPVTPGPARETEQQA